MLKYQNTQKFFLDSTLGSFSTTKLSINLLNCFRYVLRKRIKKGFPNFLKSPFVYSVAELDSKPVDLSVLSPTSYLTALFPRCAVSQNSQLGFLTLSHNAERNYFGLQRKITILFMIIPNLILNI